MATVTELEDTLEAALDYESSGSVALARTAVATVQKLLLRRRSSASHEGSSHAFDTAGLREILLRAENFVRANTNNSGVRFLGVGENFR